MESEYSSADKGEVDAGCEEVVLPTSSVTNGAISEVGDGAAEYLEEHDPMAEHNVDTAKVETTDAAQLEEGEDYEETAEEEEEAEVDEDEVEGEDADGEDADAEADEGTEVATERKPTQVPKKRKDAVMLAAAADGDARPNRKGGAGQVEQQDKALDAGDEDGDDGEQPTSTARAAANKDNTVDEEQCRVCTTKDDLVSLFKKVDQLTVAEMLMTICPKVSIARKDFMPQFICNPCLDNITIAMQLKTQCEKTEHELRKKLSRSKNKVRRPTGFVVIDGPVESDPASEDDEEQNDEEFKVSDETGLSMEDDSDDSDFESTKKKPARGAGGKRGRRKSAATTPASKPQPKKRMGRPPKRLAESSLTLHSSDEGDEQPMPIKRKKKKQAQSPPGEQPPQEYPCDECEQVFTRKLSLVLHKKGHGGRQPINCEVCGKQFKIQGAYRTHLERHKEDATRFECGKCEMVFNSRADLRYHLADDHQEEGVVFQCDKCKRSFVTEVRLKKHQDGHCPGFETKQKKHDYENYAVGKDLFKAVAPLTTTYWSDSFSD